VSIIRLNKPNLISYLLIRKFEVTRKNKGISLEKNFLTLKFPRK